MQQAEVIQKNWEALRREGAPVALKFLFDHFYDPLFAYACRLLHREDLAKDAVQNTFLDLWQYRHNLAAKVPVRSYLFRSVRNHCGKLQKKHKAYVDIEDLSQQLCFEPDELTTDHESLLQKQKITQILNGLSPRQKEIFYLKFYEDLSYREIAEILSINYQSVVNHAHKGIIRLRENGDV